MSRYDWGFGQAYGGRWNGGSGWYDTPREEMGMRRDWRGGYPLRPGEDNGYDEEFRGYRRMRYGRWDGPQGGTGGGYFGAGGPRGEYGDAYPGFGYPGGIPRGSNGGGSYGGYDRGDYERGAYQGGGYGRASQGRGYDAGHRGPAGGTFLPEEAYRRHPELSQQPRARQWESHDHAWDEEDLSDDEIVEAVQQRMYEDPWLDVERIQVAVEDGVVTLTGEVDDFLEARYAWDDAWEAEGVRGVVNHLTVRTDQPQPVREHHGDVVIQGAGHQTTADALAASESAAPSSGVD